jgi:hypothetical protein
MTIMPSALRESPQDQSRYTIAELIELRRKMLRFARSVPPGPARDHHRQIELSLRTLFKSRTWLATHVIED